MSLLFNGTSSFARTPTLDLTSYTQLSFSMWLYWDVFVNNDDLCIETSPNTNTNTNGFFIDPNSSDGSVWTTAIKTAAGFNGIGFTRPSALEWGHYVFTIDRNAGAQQWTNVYRNGIGLSLTQKYVDTGTGHFGNFQWNFMSRNGTTLFGAGKMAEVSIFPGVLLSQNEASALYYGVNPLELRSDVKPYYWKMEGDSLLYRQDSSAQSLDFSSTSVTIDNHPPMGMEFDFWNDSYYEDLDVGATLEGACNITSDSQLGLNLSASRYSNVYQAINGDVSVNITKSAQISFNASLRATILSDLIRQSTIESSLTSRLLIEPNIARDTALNLLLLGKLGLGSNLSKESNTNALFISDLAFSSQLNRSCGLNTEYASRLFTSFNSSRNSSVSGSINNELSFYTDLLNSRLLNSTLPLNSDLSSSIGASKGVSFESAIRLVMLSDGNIDSFVSIETLLTSDSAISLSMERSSNIDLSMANKLAFSSSLNRLISSSVIHTSSSDISAIIESARQLDTSMSGRLILIANTDSPSSLVLTYNFDVYIYTNYANVMNISRSLPVNLFILPNEC